MPNYLMCFVVALVLAAVVTPLVIRLAFKTGAIDQPDARKVHSQPIPRIGGLAIFLSFMLTVFFMTDFSALPDDLSSGELGLLLGGTLIVVLGLVDDFCNLPAKVKLLGQIICALVVVVGFDVRIDFITAPFGGYLYTEYLAIPLTLFWFVGFTNTVNLIDGLDGLAAGVAGIAALTIFAVALTNEIFVVATLTIILAGSVIGFLFYNFNPAKIFMGDTGSMFLGFMLAGISVIGAVKTTATITLVIPLLALGVPIMDTSFAIIRRYRGGVPIFKPDKGHLHHRLLDKGFSQRQAVLLVYAVSIFLGLTAIIFNAFSGVLAMLLALVVLVLIVLGAEKLGILKINKH